MRVTDKMGHQDKNPQVIQYEDTFDIPDQNSVALSVELFAGG